MAIVLTKKKVSEDEFQKAKRDYGCYIKITADLKSGIVALGGEYHADAEKLLLEQGSKQENIWGGGINLENGQLETNAIINLRPGGNESPEILDAEKRKVFLSLAKKILEKYVR